ncbi:MAG TPA: hypothetical protein QF604_21225, partial [Candidatus Latescibacteria bacterium]|nr:hypothetical protein [Candidatus Latescibacterota bacterium]
HLELDRIEDGPFVHPLGGEGLQVCVEYLPLGTGSRHVSFDAEIPLSGDDKAPSMEATAVYVRLTQVDGARAWSSPFYVSRG